ncbi:zinc transporter ZntB [Pseudooceanicola sp. 216_PA32_1]|uniref:Zinc transporter ZntB n=1 Tax=Pseudooceanicola pacificus TaxID=2676438 RepID=A0A844WEL4_9RHOB|nr:zinc transporter ZntB [Pseudooceanicola pacificus]MWB79848.1 zinc transporter ZntB [Pseudooceanicola pacificus]
MNHCVNFAYALNGPMEGQRLDPATAVEVLREQNLGWVHLAADHPDTQAWVAGNLDYLHETIIEALLAPATRPRAIPIEDGLLVILRGVNMNEGRDPEDMVSIRVWADAERIVTLTRQRVRALEDISQAIEAGHGPETAGEFLAMLAQRLNARLEPLVHDLDQETDALEEDVIGSPGQTLRKRIVEMRLQVIELRRHASPQRLALAALEDTGSPLLDGDDLRHIQETRDRLTRQVENLDEMRDSLAVLREELSSQLSDRLNRNMYILSILSAIFLPLGFLTGLLGINVGGMPGAQDPDAFWYVSGGLLAVGLLQVLFLRRARWL